MVGLQRARCFLATVAAAVGMILSCSAGLAAQGQPAADSSRVLQITKSSEPIALFCVKEPGSSITRSVTGQLKDYITEITGHVPVIQWLRSAGQLSDYTATSGIVIGVPAPGFCTRLEGDSYALVTNENKLYLFGNTQLASGFSGIVVKQPMAALRITLPDSGVVITDSYPYPGITACSLGLDEDNHALSIRVELNQNDVKKNRNWFERNMTFKAEEKKQ